MKKLTQTLVAALVFNAIFAHAAEPTNNWTKADEVQANLLKRYPSTKISDIKETPIEGVFQVTMGKNIAYVDKSGRYFMFGRLFDMQNQLDLSESEQKTIQKMNFDSLPLKDAIKIKKGNAKRVFAVFTDPDCPYCKQLESTVSRMDNYTMYVFLFPIASLHPDAPQTAQSIWCASSSYKVFQAYVLDGVKPKTQTCNNPIQRNIELAEKLGVSGTPTLFHASGKMSAGAMSRQDLEAWLDDEGSK